jgi:hypothetical protein
MMLQRSASPGVATAGVVAARPMPLRQEAR